MVAGAAAAFMSDGGAHRRSNAAAFQAIIEDAEHTRRKRDSP
jgi:hypothetical protein